MYIEKVLHHIDRRLVQYDFVLKEEGDKTAKLLYYSRENNFIVSGIRFLSKIYENNHFYGFVNCNQVPLVENIVAFILFNNKITAVRPEEVYNTIMTRDYEMYRLPAKGLLVDSEQKAKEVIKMFDRFYNEYFIPFYEKWDSLYTLYEFIKDKEGREELHPILGMFWQFKKATILRLCNDESYQNYMDAFVESRQMILSKVPESIDVQRYYGAAKELKEILDKTEPVYNI
ncbi:hypothetical protein [Flavobacterium sp. NKUCC04_CG]|uniref:hypothetical protein n=1 Tax=Flavobacterium sp. NKUCC04_CG TaxID=2842121 RepID=UPI001C5B59FB|nr:hypothetical protein [Flavobacterium sp. NKUCC04_CG]MBW3520009.1 hypothetical protein [Flavobacterium sp. NKUCC04_CG]